MSSAAMRKIPAPCDGKRWKQLRHMSGVMKAGGTDGIRKQIIDWGKQYGPVMRFYTPFESVIISSPELIKGMMKEDPRKWGRMKTITTILGPWLGSSLVATDGETWRRKRTVYNNAFKRKALLGYATTFNQTAHELNDYWNTLLKEQGKDSLEVDIPDSFSRATLDVIGRTAFSQEFGQLHRQHNQGAEAILDIANALTDRMMKKPLLALLPDWMFYYTATGKQQARGLKAMSELSDKVIADRRANPVEGKDLLAYLMESVEDTSIENPNDRRLTMTNEELKREINLFFFAGHDTTSITLSWTFYHLFQYPELLERVRNEMQTVLNGQDPTFDQLSDLHFTNSCLKESLRLHPPAIMFGREALEDTTMGEYTIPKGTQVMCSALSVHYDSDIYGSDVLTWDPTRWEDENRKPAPSAWMPFSMGPRNCIGMGFALAEAKAILAQALMRWDATALTTPRHEQRLVHIPANMKMSLKPRT